MSSALLVSKLFIPPVRPDLVRRQRLIEHLNAGNICKLTLVSAPAGFGKTTLIATWVAAVGRPAAWISLDHGDNDLSRFLRYFIAALRQFKPEVCAATKALIETASHGASKLPLDSLLPALSNEISEISIPFFLILDDYHNITEPEVHQTVKFILETMPRSMQLIIASRADPPWSLALLRAHNELNEVRVGELRFTTEEAASFLNDAMRLNLRADEVSALEERTEGWIAGLQMAALSMRGRTDIHDFITAFAGSHHFIADFLVEEVLNRQPEYLREFLLKTSILERMTAPLCDAVTGRSDSRVMLAKLEQANLFLISIDDERKWFRFHHLFRDLLRTNLEYLMPKDVPGLHRSASLWYLGAGMYEESISHAFSSKDYGLAAGQIEQAAKMIDIENKIVTITHWIEDLPEEFQLSRPWLCVYRAWGCYWTGQRDQVESWLQSAEAALAPYLDASQDTSHQSKIASMPDAEQKHIMGHIASIRSHHALTNEDIPGVLKYSQQALELLPEGDDMRTETAVALGGAYWGLGDVAATERTFAMARANAMKGGNASLVVPSTCYLGMQQTKQGRLKDAMMTYRNALQYACGPGGGELPAAGFPNIKIGDLMREWNYLEDAGQYLNRGVQQCIMLGQADVMADGFVALARLHMAKGELENAQESLRRASQVKERTRIDPFVQCWLDDCQLRLWLIQDDYDAAANWAKTSGLKVDSPLSYHYDLNHINLVRWLIAQGKHNPAGKFVKDAQRLLVRLYASAEKAGWIQEQIKILILQSQVFQRMGDSAEAVRVLEAALRMAEPGGYVRIFVDEGDDMLSLIEANQYKFRNHSPGLTAYLNQLLPEFTHAHEVSLQTGAAGKVMDIAEPLTERELEVLRLLPSGMTSNDIAEVLFIATSTARTHIKNIYGKLMVNRRMEAVQRARELGLIK